MLGIDIGQYSVKVASIKRQGKRAVIDKMAIQPLPIEMRGGVADILTLQQIITRLVRQINSKDKVAALSVPTTSTILKKMTLDKHLSGELLEGEIQLELVDLIPFSLEQVYIDFVLLGQSKQNPDKQRVLVAVCRRDVVDKVAHSLVVPSIKEKHVDIAAFALGQLMPQLQGGRGEGVWAVLDIGYRSSNFSVFKADEMLYSREQPVGGHHLTELVADAVGLDLEAAESLKLNTPQAIDSLILDSYLDLVGEQLVLALEFFANSHADKIEHLYLTGGGSKVEGLSEMLKQRLPQQAFSLIPINKLIKLEKNTSSVPADEVGYFMATAVGLAMRS